MGPHRRDDVRVRHRDEPHRGDQHRPQRRELRLDEARRATSRTAMTRPGGALNQLYPAAGGRPGRAPEGRVHLSGRDLRPRRGAGGHRRVRVPRPHRRAARQVRVRRHQARTAVRGRPRRDEEGRRRHSADRGAGRGDPALRARRAAATATNVTFQELVERTMGATVAARRPAHQPQPRRRAVHHVAAGRHDPDARAVGLAIADPGFRESIKDRTAMRASRVFPEGQHCSLHAC